MKKIFFLPLLLSLFICCGPKQDEVERYMEDGTAVIVNHLEPYKIKGGPSSLFLYEDYVIDLEREDLVKLGLTDVDCADVDSEGNVYFVNDTSKAKIIILKLDREGNFLTSFGRKGQGPGEIQFVLYFGIDSKDRIIISDQICKKILLFDKKGHLINETRYGTNLWAAFPLENGKYIAIQDVVNPSKETNLSRLILCGAEFKEIKELDVFNNSNSLRGKKIALRHGVFEWKVARDKIYIGNEKRGYEIWVYDLEGNLLRKIRKNYEHLLYPEEFKKQVETMFLRRPDWKQLYFVPKQMPPFNSFFIDEDERLYVMTYEKGEKKEEYIHDIFNSDGVFIGKVSIERYGNLHHSLYPLRAIAKNNRLYCLREKDSGYKELVVYKMNWEQK